MPIDSETKQRARQYVRSHNLEITDEMGSGFDGVVFSTSRPSAVKALKHEELYRNEKAVYLRLNENDIQEIDGFSVPQLIHFDDECWVIEMDIVTRPYVLDFAGAYLDKKPPYLFNEEVMGEWQKEKEEIFGDRWDTVTGIMASFRRHGYTLPTSNTATSSSDRQ